jgi:hypothetical protein
VQTIPSFAITANSERGGDRRLVERGGGHGHGHDAAIWTITKKRRRSGLRTQDSGLRPSDRSDAFMSSRPIWTFRAASGIDLVSLASYLSAREQRSSEERRRRRHWLRSVRSNPSIQPQTKPTDAFVSGWPKQNRLLSTEEPTSTIVMTSQ